MNDIKLQTNPNGSVTLCGRPGKGRCCPVMSSVDENNVRIDDDFGGSITITKDQASLIANGLQTLEESAKIQLLNE